MRFIGTPVFSNNVRSIRVKITIDVEHHFPKRRPDRLVEAKPHLSATTKGVRTAF